MQRLTSDNHIIPFLDVHLKENSKVCEVGCAEAGTLKAFLDQGHSCVGIELSESRLLLAKENLKAEEKEGRAHLFNKNIFDTDLLEVLPYKFDLIILKDVIEHLPDKTKVLQVLKACLNPGGVVFFAFPPWWMPFGGHQQAAKSKFLKNFVYVHLLPKFIYKNLLKMANESDSAIQELMELTDTGINIGPMRTLLRKEGFTILADKHWLFNPIYEYKFKLKPKTVIPPFRNIPLIRNLYTTCYYVVFRP